MGDGAGQTGRGQDRQDIRALAHQAGRGLGQQGHVAVGVLLDHLQIFAGDKTQIRQPVLKTLDGDIENRGRNKITQAHPVGATGLGGQGFFGR